MGDDGHLQVGQPCALPQPRGSRDSALLLCRSGTQDREWRPVQLWHGQEADPEQVAQLPPSSSFACWTRIGPKQTDSKHLLKMQHEFHCSKNHSPPHLAGPPGCSAQILTVHHSSGLAPAPCPWPQPAAPLSQCLNN